MRDAVIREDENWGLASIVHDIETSDAIMIVVVAEPFEKVQVLVLYSYTYGNISFVITGRQSGIWGFVNVAPFPPPVGHANICEGLVFSFAMDSPLELGALSRSQLLLE